MADERGAEWVELGPEVVAAMNEGRELPKVLQALFHVPRPSDVDDSRLRRLVRRLLRL